MRKQFFEILLAAMAKDDKIIFLTGDLGYGLADPIKEAYPERFYNVGAAEQVLITAGVGLALSGKIPVCYSITPFLLHRPYEAIKLYLQGEQVPVKLVGSGLDDDYESDGISHHAFDVDKLLNLTPSIVQYYPNKTDNLDYIVQEMLYNTKPSFLALRR